MQCLWHSSENALPVVTRLDYRPVSPRMVMPSALSSHAQTLMLVLGVAQTNDSIGANYIGVKDRTGQARLRLILPGTRIWHKGLCHRSSHESTVRESCVI